MIKQWGIVKKGSNLGGGENWYFDIIMSLSFSSYDYSISFGSTNDNGSSWASGEEICGKKLSDYRTLKCLFFCRNTYTDAQSPCVNWFAIGY